MILPFRRARLLVALAVVALSLIVPSVAQAALTREPATFPDVTGWTNNVGDVLTCVPGSYSGAGNINVTISWERDGVPVGAGPITLTTNDFRVTFVCKEHATSDDGEITMSSLPISLVEQPPAVVSQPSVNGTVFAGRAASCDGAAFAGYNLSAISYSWTKTGVGEVGTQKSYTPTRADIGYDITCRASVTNPGGSAEAYAGQYRVEDGSPNVDVSPKISGKAIAGLAVTCSPGTWSGDGNTFTYQWLLDDKPIAGATSTRLLLLDRFYEKAVACRVTATNSSGSTSTESNIVSPNHPAILAPLARKQPPLPKVKIAIAKGITSRLACNASCATESHAMMLVSDARPLGIRGREVGGFIIVGIGHAKRTFKGELLVTTTFTPSAKKGLAKIRKPTRVDLIFETAWGPRYAFKMYHVAAVTSIKLRR